MTRLDGDGGLDCWLATALSACAGALVLVGVIVLIGFRARTASAWSGRSNE